jgi:exopolyphosphatase / guanosine-5'-triphosphate,3'-diphosphate pyrophosphatase
MKLASIDIGTNSIRLLIVDYSKKNHTLIFITIAREMVITRIGKNLSKAGRISRLSAKKTLDVLSDYLNLIKKEKVEKYRAIGTSALRQAKNSKWFLSYIEKRLGMKIDIIDGKEEAALSFCGAVKNLNLNLLKDKKIDNNILVIDIGGGSTEFILGSLNGRIIFSESIDLGCVNLTEKFINYSKPAPEDLELLNNYIRDKIEKLIIKISKNNFNLIIGLGGTISTLAAVDLKLARYDRDRIHNHILKFDNIKLIYDQFCQVDLDSRKKITGLEEKRTDIIIGGIALLLEIMKMLEFDKILVSENDILDGIIYSILDFC